MTQRLQLRSLLLRKEICHLPIAELEGNPKTRSSQIGSVNRAAETHLEGEQNHNIQCMSVCNTSIAWEVLEMQNLWYLWPISDPLNQDLQLRLSAGELSNSY